MKTFWRTIAWFSDNAQAKVLLERIERIAPQILAVVTVCAGLDRLAVAASSPLAGDEMITWSLARHPSASILWRALGQGADAQPPLFYMIEGLFQRWIPNEQIALRLPAILALCGAFLCVFFIVKRHTRSICGLACAIFLLSSLVFQLYGVQARPYSLVVAAIAFAMLCYQRADGGLWAFALFLSLAFAVSLHYYGIFALGAFLAAEAAYFLAKRRVRMRVWAAVCCGGLPLAAFWPLLSAQRRIFGEHFWAQPKLSVAISTYGSLAGVSAPLGLAFAFVLGLSLVAKWRWSDIAESGPERRMSSPFHEQVLALGLLLMPAGVLVAARLAHGALMDRYVLWVSLGMAYLLGCLLSELSPANLLRAVAFLAVAVAAQEAFSLYPLRGHIGRFESPAADVQRLVNSAGHPELPVVVWADNIAISHYASPGLAKRLVTLVDPKSALTYLGTDNVDKFLLALAPYGDFKVCEFTSFAAAHSTFLLYSTGDAWSEGTVVFYDWWVPRLAHDGYSLRVMAAEGNSSVYLVSRPRKDTQESGARE